MHSRPAPSPKRLGSCVDDVAKRLGPRNTRTHDVIPSGGNVDGRTQRVSHLKKLTVSCHDSSIRGEIDRVADGEWPVDESPLRYAPHTAEDLLDRGNGHIRGSSAPILSQGFASRSILPPSHELMERQVTEI